MPLWAMPRIMFIPQHFRDTCLLVTLLAFGFTLLHGPLTHIFHFAHVATMGQHPTFDLLPLQPQAPQSHSNLLPDDTDHHVTSELGTKPHLYTSRMVPHGSMNFDTHDNSSPSVKSQLWSHIPQWAWTIWSIWWCAALVAGLHQSRPKFPARMALATTSGASLDTEEGMDVIQDTSNDEPTFALWRFLDQWHARLPALRPSYEDKLYIRQRRVNPDVNPGSYTWMRLRHVAFAIVAVFLSWRLINVMTYEVLCHIHRNFQFGLMQQEHLSAAFQRAMALVRYEQIMVYETTMMTPQDSLAKIQALAAQYESEEKERFLKAIANRVSDTIFGSSLFLLMLVNWSELRFIWNQVRLLIRLNFRTPFRAVILLFLSDVVLGFHSNELWILFLTYLGNRYGLKVGSGHWINIVKAIVPVGFDVGFKFVVFYYMQRKTQVILREMNDM